MILVITDSNFMYKAARPIIDEITEAEYHTTGTHFDYDNGVVLDLPSICLHNIEGEYDFILSLHCKKIFPKEIIERYLCLNLHPGFNPYNRGYASYLFSLYNKLPAGATFHIMDDQIDHGPIIGRVRVDFTKKDTVATLYPWLMSAELALLRDCLPSVLTGKYISVTPDEGNLNTKEDYEHLKKSGAFDHYLV